MQTVVKVGFQLGQNAANGLILDPIQSAYPAPSALRAEGVPITAYLSITISL